MPKLRPLFKGDMTDQGAKLMAVTGTAVDNLHQLGTIAPAVQALAARHVSYGVADAYYETAGTSPPPFATLGPPVTAPSAEMIAASTAARSAGAA